MTISDTLQETYVASSANKTRSGLTILGIVIGISSVIAMVSIGSGASNSISSSIQALGSNLSEITPGAPRTVGGFGVSSGRGGAKTLTQGDADAILSECRGRDSRGVEVSGRYQITAKGTNTNTTVDGVTSAYPTIRNVAISDGSFISRHSKQLRFQSGRLGPTTRDDLFGTGATDGSSVKHIRIKGMEFKVIGITVSKGGTGFGNADDMIYIPVVPRGTLSFRQPVSYEH